MQTVDQPGDGYRVLHVDDDPSQTDLLQAYFAQTTQEHTVLSCQSPTEALAILEKTEIDCVVSDYDMPELTGLDLLKEVRNEHPDLPFILLTGKGSEEIASQAINSGVTGYLQKGGPDQLDRVINRVEHAAEEYRAKITSERYATVLSALNYPVYVVDDTAAFEYVNEAFVEMVGYDRDELIGNPPSLIKTEEGVRRANDALRSVVSSSGPDRIRFRVDIHTKDGEVVPCHDHMAALPFDEEFRGSVGILRNISQQERRRKQLQKQNEHLENILAIVSHDLRTPLSSASSGVALARETGDSGAFDRVERALDRMEMMVAEVQTLAQTGLAAEESTDVDVQKIATRAWEAFSRDADQLEVGNFTVEGDPKQVRSLVENLLRNAVEHNNPGVTVRIGVLGDAEGFFVADDGSGIPSDNGDQLFEPGYTTAADGTGYGTAIVRRIADAHGWDVEVTDSRDGGARFEIHGADNNEVSDSSQNTEQTQC